MKPILTIAGLSALAVISLAIASKSPLDGGKAADRSSIERGHYLVHQVAMCVDCHSPRGPDGQFVEELHLSGSPLPFVSTVPMPWAPLAPNLAGLPAGYGKEDMVRFLMTGDRPHGLPPTLPPMPPVRLQRSDAEAVADYLSSLAPRG